VNGGSDDAGQDDVPCTVINVAGHSSPEVAEEEDGIKPLPDRLVTELTAHRTLALRDALANDPDTSFLAVLHALCLQAFYQFAPPTCLEITAKSAGFGIQAPGLGDTASAKVIDERHERWAGLLPEDQADLWDTLIGFDADSRAALFAHCASVSVNAVHEAWNRNPGRLAHATQLAQMLNLDMVEAGWAPTVENYLGRVTKARILEAVREAKGEAASQLIDHLKKPEMANEAERLLAGTGWLPEPLRNAVHVAPDDSAEADAPSAVLPAFLSAPDPGDEGEMIAAE
jgi:ParB family chromosome partitioning protein